MSDVPARAVRSMVATKIRARMYAKGLLSALAHDLELDLPTTETSIEQAEDGTWSGRLVVAIDAIRVVGVLRRGKVATDVLSSNDRNEIERRLREACAPAKSLVVTARGRVNASGKAERPELYATLENKPRAPLRADLLTLLPKGEGFEVRTEGSISMRALGLPEIKGPLSAFVMKDDVHFEATLTVD